MAHQGGGDALPGERRQHPDVGHGRVTHIGVLPSFTRQGIATTSLRAAKSRS
ncbi:hypothetical protein JHV675_40250 [Mycobacterium avium subsp. hominissuis]